MYVDKVDLFSNPVVAILRIVSFSKLGTLPKEDPNSQSFVPQFEDFRS